MTSFILAHGTMREISPHFCELVGYTSEHLSQPGFIYRLFPSQDVRLLRIDGTYMLQVINASGEAVPVVASVVYRGLQAYVNVGSPTREQ